MGRKGGIHTTLFLTVPLTWSKKSLTSPSSPLHTIILISNYRLISYFWLSSGVYSRKHLDTLVELVHETLKTLDTAACKYGNPNAEKKKTKQKNVRDERTY
jgi:hypothetical protein